jgi:hypothetical protein
MYLLFLIFTFSFFLHNHFFVSLHSSFSTFFTLLIFSPSSIYSFIPPFHFSLLPFILFLFNLLPLFYSLFSIFFHAPKSIISFPFLLPLCIAFFTPIIPLVLFQCPGLHTCVTI